MQLSTEQAAKELGVTARQVRRAASTGAVKATRFGSSHSVSARQVQVLARTRHRGRNWSDTTRNSALDLLVSGTTNALRGSELSRMKHRIRTANVGALAGQILRDRVSLRRASGVTRGRSFMPKLLAELGLSSGGGLGILVTNDAHRVAKQNRLALDDSGDIVIVEGNDKHASALEVFALYAFGDTRESSAAEQWIKRAQGRV
ncbi:hypothetical protein [Paramicrobacterium chengjingii]|uniref:Helix-turn-helix domain-containing protein n=1 Tax=Paramicrobacterium chengjingii TaxID=2769067 RepID=A0ABX6YFE1_9MICO|nr:hypothetical protein [Microbacterium chengjingii]QPZ37494.1 hypothetical protein HCR76_11680 [Microbacterium chengjingii]